MILKEFKVGISKREDTYTTKLGFINYKKLDGTWKHKISYDKWIDPNIPEEEYENDLQTGFVINNNVGYMSYGDGREPKVRILDPRGFEIEITMGNFFHIISYGVSEGKMLNGSYCYGIVNDRLTLVHEQEVVYEESPLRLYVKDEPLVIGNTYYTSFDGKTDRYIYVGEKEFEVMKRNKLTTVTKNVFIRIENRYMQYAHMEYEVKPNKFKSVDATNQQLIAENIRLNGGFEHLIKTSYQKVTSDIKGGFGMDRYIAVGYVFFLNIGGKTYKTHIENAYNICWVRTNEFRLDDYYGHNLKNLTEVTEPVHIKDPMGDKLEYDEIKSYNQLETVELLKQEFTTYLYTYEYNILELLNESIKNRKV